MTVSFNEIPNNWRVPLVWVEIDPTKASIVPSQMPYKVLIMAHASKNDAPKNEPMRATSAAQVAKFFGADSLLAAQAAAYFKANTTTETFFVALPEPAGAAAKLTVTFTGTASDGGNIYLYIGDRRISAYVAPGSTGAEAAAAVITAAALSGYTLTAGENSGEVLITAAHNGSYGNGQMVRLGYHQGEDLPKGLTVGFTGGLADNYTGSPTPDWEISAALTGLVAFHGNNDPARPFQSLIIPGMLPPRPGTYARLSGGTGSVDLTPLFVALGDTQYHLVNTPWLDEAALAALKEWAADRWQALKAIPAQIIGAKGGSHTALGELGDRHNSHYLTILGTGGPFTDQECNLLLYDGISTYYANQDGGCNVQRLITTYKTNAWGAEDLAYLDLNTPLTLTYLRYDYRGRMAKLFPRHKLCNDGTNFGYGQAMVTPKMIKGETIAWFKDREKMGLVENIDQFKNDLIVERNAQDPCRVDVYLPPNVVNQLRVLAVQLGFRL